MSTMDTVSRRPRLHVVLYCTLVLQLLSHTLAFVPLSRQGTFRLSAVEIDASVSADKWLKEQIELKKEVDGSTIIDHACVVGPKHVIIYDTTLRGMCVLRDIVCCACSLSITTSHSLNHFHSCRWHSRRIRIGVV
jgi:hypothetical protein